MSKTRTYFLAVIAVVVFSSGLVTNAFFYDSETSLGNVFTAALLDTEVSGHVFDAQLCSLGSSAKTFITYTNLLDMSIEYDVRSENITGDLTFCDAIEFTATRNDSEVYFGTIAGFDVGTFPLGPLGEDDWELKVHLPSGTPTEIVDGKQCFFDTTFFAHQEMLPGGGFHDEETLSHSLLGFAPSGGSLGDITIINNNNATVTNNITVVTNTGGNTASSSGNISTGDATSTVTIEENINENTTTVEGCGVCGSPCGDPCDNPCDEPCDGNNNEGETYATENEEGTVLLDVIPAVGEEQEDGTETGEETSTSITPLSETINERLEEGREPRTATSSTTR